MFQNLPIEIDNKLYDAVQGGILSCAYFVSAILKINNLIKNVHATVSSTVKDMKEFGWFEIDKNSVQAGDVIVWESIDFGDGDIHKHIGFYLGNNLAISNSEIAKTPIEHAIPLMYGEQIRSIETIFRYPWI
jgi:hypothetical protein